MYGLHLHCFVPYFNCCAVVARKPLHLLSNAVLAARLYKVYHPSSNSQLFNNLSLSFSFISMSLGLMYSPLMLPSTIYNTKEHLAATFASCVNIIIVVTSSFNFTSSSITPFDAVLFKAPVGTVKLVQTKPRKAAALQGSFSVILPLPSPRSFPGLYPSGISP